MAEIDELKKLSPGERIKKLKELEASRKREIEEAETLIRESEKEITLTEELKNIPIPQVMAPDLGHLFGSPGEKEVFKSKRFVEDKAEDVFHAERPEEPQSKSQGSGLEDTVEREAPKGQVVERLRMYGQLLENREINPGVAVAALADAYGAIKKVREEFDSGRGYDDLSSDERRLLHYASEIAEQIPQTYVNDSQFRNAVHGVFEQLEKIREHYHR